MNICRLEGCEKSTRYGRTLCSMHIGRYRRTGSYELRSPEEIFWSRVEKTETCWLWVGFTNRAGYGRTTFTGVTYLAHRLSYLLTTGTLPPDLPLDHLCLVRNCVNPDHLEPVTVGENNRRAWKVRRANAGLPEPVCGTYGGYNLHHKLGEVPCDECKRARREHKPRSVCARVSREEVVTDAR